MKYKMKINNNEEKDITRVSDKYRERKTEKEMTEEIVERETKYKIEVKTMVYLCTCTNAKAKGAKPRGGDERDKRKVHGIGKRIESKKEKKR
jgi:hypothetical protein